MLSMIPANVFSRFTRLLSGSVMTTLVPNPLLRVQTQHKA